MEIRCPKSPPCKVKGQNLLPRFVVHIATYWGFVVASSGCSINGIGIPGSVDQKIVNSPHARQITTSARGLHFYTRGGLGAHLGTIEREVLYPGVSDHGESCFAYALDSPRLTDSVGMPEYGEKAFRINRSSIGAGIELSPYRFTAGAGVSRRLEFHGPIDRSFSYYYVLRDGEENLVACMDIGPMDSHGDNNDKH